MTQSKQIIYLTLTYTALRALSFVFPPATPLHAAASINTLIAGAILLITTYLLLKKSPYGWYLVAGEIILGGTGNFFSFFGLSLRTALLLVSLTIFFLWQQPPRTWKSLLLENKTISLIIGALLTVVAFSALRGFLFHHSLALLRADVIPYLFFLYYFPL